MAMQIAIAAGLAAVWRAAENSFGNTAGLQFLKITDCSDNIFNPFDVMTSFHRVRFLTDRHLDAAINS